MSSHALPPPPSGRSVGHRGTGVPLLTSRHRGVTKGNARGRYALRIPASASLTATGVGLPVVHPAAGLYSAMFAQAKPQPGQRRVPADTATSLVTWLDPGHRERAAELLSGGLRLAQEWVGLSHLSRSDDWLRGFRAQPS